MPTILKPQAGTIVRLDGPLVVHGTNVTLGGALFNGMQVQISTDTGAGFEAAIVYDSLKREPDGHVYGGDTDEGFAIHEIDVSAIPLASATTYYIRYRECLDTPSTSAWSAEVSVTTETRPSYSDWRNTR